MRVSVASVSTTRHVQLVLSLPTDPLPLAASKAFAQVFPLPFPVQLSISSRLSLTVLTRSCVSWEDLLTSRLQGSVTAVTGIGTNTFSQGLILAGFFSLSSLSIPSVLVSISDICLQSRVF